MRLAGFRGSLEGYEDALFWREPAVATNGGVCFPSTRRWAVEHLGPISSSQVEAFTLLDGLDLRITPGDVLICCGPVFAGRLRSLGIEINDYLRGDSTSSFILATGTLTYFAKLESLIAEAGQIVFWRLFRAGALEDANSALKVLGQVSAFDRRRWHLLAALLAIGVGDGSRLRVGLALGSAELGVSEEELSRAALEMWVDSRAMRGSEDVHSTVVSNMDKALDLAAKTQELGPAIRVADLSRGGQGDLHIARIATEIDKAERQRTPVRLDFDGTSSHQRTWLPHLALIAHQLEHGYRDVDVKPYLRGSPVETLTLKSGAGAALERSGITRALKWRADSRNTRLLIPASRSAVHTHTIETKTTDALSIAGFHRGVDTVFDRELLQQIVPSWLRQAFKKSTPGFHDNAERVVAELMKNVREHSGIERSGNGHSMLRLGATRGGGDDSTDRLWVIVSDSGVGIRSSLEHRAGQPLDFAPTDLIEGIMSSDSPFTGADRFRQLTGAGDGLADVYTSCLEVGQQSGYPFDLFLLSTSDQDDGNRESLIAQAQGGDRQISSDVLHYGAVKTGTLAIVMLPTGSASPSAENPEASNNVDATLFDSVVR